MIVWAEHYSIRCGVCVCVSATHSLQTHRTLAATLSVIGVGMGLGGGTDSYTDRRQRHGRNPSSHKYVETQLNVLQFDTRANRQ